MPGLWSSQKKSSLVWRAPVTVTVCVQHSFPFDFLLGELRVPLSSSLKFKGADCRSRVAPRPRPANQNILSPALNDLFLCGHMTQACPLSLKPGTFTRAPGKISCERVDCISTGAGGHLVLGESLPENKACKGKSRAKKR